jgi:hypothetical protein
MKKYSLLLLLGLSTIYAAEIKKDLILDFPEELVSILITECGISNSPHLPTEESRSCKLHACESQLLNEIFKRRILIDLENLRKENDPSLNSSIGKWYRENCDEGIKGLTKNTRIVEQTKKYIHNSIEEWHKMNNTGKLVVKEQCGPYTSYLIKGGPTFFSDHVLNQMKRHIPKLNFTNSFSYHEIIKNNETLELSAEELIFFGSGSLIIYVCKWFMKREREKTMKFLPC